MGGFLFFCFLKVKIWTLECGFRSLPLRNMSDERSKPFPFDEFEPRWQERWANEKTYRTPNPGEKDFDATKPKYYVLDMFPYPSGAGLHLSLIHI